MFVAQDRQHFIEAVTKIFDDLLAFSMV